MVLVSIIGDFYSSVLPVFFELKDKLLKHIIVYDDFKKDEKKALKIIDSIDSYSKHNNLNIITEPYKIDEDSYTGILKLAEHIKKSTFNGLSEVYINSTDGLSSINTILSRKLADEKIKFISYDRYDNQYNLVFDDSLEVKKLSSSIPIMEHFKFKGVEVKSYEDKSFALKYEDEIKTIFAKYKDEYIRFKSYAFNNKYLTDTEQFPNVAPIIIKMGLTDLNQHQVLLTGTLYEYYVFLLLKDLDIDDIEVGVVLHDYGLTDYYIPNEFDILLMKNNHLHMIECKFTNKVKPDAIVYKYIALQTLLDEDGKMMILLNNDKYKKELNLKDYTSNLPYKRALHKDILLRGTILGNEKEFIDEIKSYLGI
jgi:hypothetical protein